MLKMLSKKTTQQFVIYNAIKIHINVIQYLEDGKVLKVLTRHFKPVQFPMIIWTKTCKFLIKVSRKDQ